MKNRKQMMRETVRIRRAALAEVAENAIRNRLAVREGESLWACVGRPSNETARETAVANGIL